jgi:hypothetical protein
VSTDSPEKSTANNTGMAGPCAIVGTDLVASLSAPAHATRSRLPSHSPRRPTPRSCRRPRAVDPRSPAAVRPWARPGR